MSYVEETLDKNEVLVKKAERNKLSLVGVWLKGILLCWLLFIPTIKALIQTISFSQFELAVTNKRVVGRAGLFKTQTLDVPLNKIQTVFVEETFFGKIFNYSRIEIRTGGEGFEFDYVKSGEAFKRMIMVQIDKYEKEYVK